MNYNFDLDLVDGQEGESYLAELLRGKKLEVKTDFGVSRTGNLVVEYSSRGRPSGISTTQADYWAFLLDGSYKKEVIVFIQTDRLKRLVTSDKFKIVTGGDNNTSKMFLIPKESLLCPV